MSLSGKPSILKLELTNRCNANCVFCNREQMKREPQDMALPDALRIIHECDFVDEVQPQLWGEPTLYPDLKNVVEYAMRHGKRVVFYTNGTGSLLGVVPTKVIFSMDAATPETFKRVRPGISFWLAYRHIKAYWEAHSSEVEIVVRATACAENRSELGRLKEFWSPLCHRVVIEEEHPMFRDSAKRGPLIEDFSCRYVDTDLVVMSSGRLALCCVDYEGEFGGGDATNGVMAAWNSDVISHNRKLVKAGKWLSLCENCAFRHRR